jgi:hypothetical protein
LRTAPLFRWTGAYWGFVAADRVYDRHGRHVGWVSGHDVYGLAGGFLGELRDEHYVLRDAIRAEPLQRAPRPAIPYLCPPAAELDRDARDPLDGWVDALPWPLPPPEPPAL